ncbi:hypothetical protein [uncultured Thiodictyon sp.]|uniref:hypothetical protein n=1 Tax=uncultured Thiodictyon sp. TaxID=1846217 RepID=UPI0025FFF6BE|nr:hypothetical protein [uncultured Thiodictyon sp.]
MKASLFLPLALTLSASCFAKTDVTVSDLIANPRAYEGKEVTIRCNVRSADLGATYCSVGNQDVSLSAKTMDKSSLKFVLAKCSKPIITQNDIKCQNVTVTAKLKSAEYPGWLDNAKVAFK